MINDSAVFICFIFKIWFDTSGSSMMSRRLPLRFVTANMTGHALWQTFANHDDDDDKTEGEMPEPVSNNI